MSVVSRPAAERDVLSRHLVSFPAGSKIYAEGGVGTEMYAVRSGEVQLTRMIAGKKRVLARLGKGDFFGEGSVLENRPRRSTARARTDVELIRVNGAELESMLRNSPEIAIRMMRDLSRRLRETSAAYEGALARRVPGPANSGLRRRASEAAFDADSRLCHLVSSDGERRFPLNRDGDTAVGRADRFAQTLPDVDLTLLDSEHSVSPCHARLYRIGTAFYVMEELGAAHGTFVNDTRLATGVPAAIHHGDVLKLGRVTLTFWNPSA